MTKGVTYISGTDGSVTGINLNGNSVIIKEAEAVSSGETSDYIDIYIDKNSDGIIDTDETKVTLSRETGDGVSNDIPVNYPIYGLYNESSTSPIRITFLSGKNSAAIYGIYKGSLLLEDTTKTGVMLDVRGGSYNVLYGVYEGELSGKCDIKIRDSKTSAPVFIAENGSKIKGDVSLDIDTTDICSIYGVSNSSTVEGNYTYLLGKDNSYNSGSSYITNSNGSVSGDIDAEIYGDTAKDKYVYFYGVNGPVGGNVNIDVKGGNFYNLYGADSYYAKVNKNFTFNVDGVTSQCVYGFYGESCGGDVKVTLKNTTFSYLYGVYGNSSSSSVSTGIGGSFTLDVDDTNTLTGYSNIYGTEYMSIAKDATITIAPKSGDDTSSNRGYIYGLYYSSVGGSANITLKNLKAYSIQGTYLNSGTQSNVITGDFTCNISNCDVTGYIYGINYGAYLGNLDVTISDNAYSGTYSSNIYGLNYFAHIEGNANITMKNNKNFSYIYGAYAGSSNDIKGKLTVLMDNCNFDSTFSYSYSNLYGIYGCVCQGDADVTIKNCASQYTYGTCSTQILGNAVINILDTDCSLNSSSNNSNQCFGVSNGLIKGTLELNITGCKFANTYVYGVDSVQLIGDADILIDGGENKAVISANSLNPVNEGSSYSSDTAELNNKITATLKNIILNSEADYLQISNYLLGKQNYKLIVDDSCEMPDNCKIYPNRNDSAEVMATATYKDNIYYSGATVNDTDLVYDRENKTGYRNVYFSYSNAILTHNISAENVYFTNGTLVIPKDITVSASEDGYIHASHYEGNNEALVIEGKLLGNIYLDATDKEGNQYCSGRFLFNGGSVSEDSLSLIKYKLYPLNITYNSDAATLQTKYIYSLKKYPEMYIAEAGRKDITVTCTPKTGYMVTGASILYDGNTTENELILSAASGNAKSCSIDMKEKPATVSVGVTGTQIIVGKTEADPVVKLNSATTLENPLYDLATLIISNDAVVGEVTYQVDSANSLPEGLVLEEGKIYGTPTSLYEEGKPVKIKVTGKNGTSAFITLNIIVDSDGGSLQTNHDGRIFVDSENKYVDLFGNSVVIEEIEVEGVKQTAIYIDDNRDGEKDPGDAVYVGDLSSYIVYGLLNKSNYEKPIKISMTGGNIYRINGLSNSSNATTDEDALTFNITGGTVRYIYGAISKSEIKGGIYYRSTGSYNFYTYDSSTSKYDGYCLDLSGKASYYGIYTIKQNKEYSSFNLSSYSTVTIPKGVTLKTDEYNGSSGSKLYNFGTLDCSSNITNNGYVYMMEGANTVGEVTDEYSWNGIYYPISFETNKEGTAFQSNNSGVISYNAGDTTQYFALADATDSVNFTSFTGYDYYYKLNDEEEKQSSSYTISFLMPRKASLLKVNYKSTQIELEKTFEAPAAVLNTEYTIEKPLYDYTKVNVLHDSYEDIDRTYELKSGSSLPEGLIMSEGKIIGTPSKLYTDGIDVTVVITGHNGTKAEFTLKYSVQGEEIDTSAFDQFTVSGSNLYLNGVSVVLYPALNDNSSYYSVYLDENHDGIADNNIPFTYNGMNSFSYNVYGYTNTETVLNKDLSIYVYSGSISYVYGAGDSKYNADKVTVNGNVSVYLKGGRVVYGLYGAYNAEVSKDVTLKTTGGTIANNTACIAKNTSVLGNVYFDISGTSAIPSTSSYIYVTSESTVNQNVYAGYTTSYSSYFGYYDGVYKSTVDGNVIYNVDGNLDARYFLAFLYESNVTGDLNVDVKSGKVNCRNSNAYNFAVARDSQVRNINFNAADGAAVSIGTNYKLNILQGSTVKDIVVKVPSTVTGSSNMTLKGESAESSISGNAVLENMVNIEIYGKYTLFTDATYSNILVYPESELTIDEAVTINCSIATINGVVKNNGNWISSSNTTVSDTGSIINNGSFVSNYCTYVYGQFVNNKEAQFNRNSTSSNAFLIIYDSGSIVNKADSKLTLNCRINNLGKIVNFGEFNQIYSGSYYNRLGVIYSVNKLNLYRDIASYYSSSYCSFYFPITADYTEYCADVELTGADSAKLASSGVEGDTNVYVMANTEFYVHISNLGPSLNVSAITYNYNGADKNCSNVVGDDIVYYGTLYYEPTTVNITFGTTAAETIAIEPESGNTSGLTVGVYGNFYNLKNVITVTNDVTDGNGYVTYTVAAGNALPEGLSLNNKTGVIYGTPKLASASPVVTKINVKGINQTVAQFTLTFDSIEKGTPTLNPGTLVGNSGEALSSISFPTSTLGSYVWEDGEHVLEDASGETKQYKAHFVPNEFGLNNYDWTKVKGGEWKETEGYVLLDVNVIINPLTPEVEVPEELIAYYGQTLEDIDLSKYSNEIGDFVWRTNKTTSVGSVGERYFYIDFISKTPKYKNLTYLLVKVVVKPIPVETVPVFGQLEGAKGDKLSELTFPEVETGRYKWISMSSTIATDGGVYTVAYVPEDVVSYDYTKIEGWSSNYKAILFDVVVYLFEDGVSKEINVDGLPNELTADHSVKLSDVALPEKKIGSNQQIGWYLNDVVISNENNLPSEIPCGHFEWETPDVILDVEGTFETTVKYIPDDERYIAATNIPVVIKINGKHIAKNEDSIENLVKATNKADGSYEVVSYCRSCGKEMKRNKKFIPMIKQVSLNATSFVFTGKEIRPSVTVKDSKGKALILNKDYSITYANNKAVGTATVKVDFKGDYAATVTNTFKINPTPTKINSLVVANDGITLNWTKNTSGSGYLVYRSDNGGAYKLISTINSNATVSFKDTSAKVNGCKYQYKLVVTKSLNKVSYNSQASNIGTTYYLLAANVWLTNEANAVKVSWSRNNGATGYQIYRSSNGGAFKLIKTISGNATVSLVDTTANVDGGKYSYKVVCLKAVNGVNYTSQASAANSICFIKNTKASLSNTTKGVKITWDKNKNATGYYLYRSINGGKTYTKIKDITKNSTGSYVDKKAKKNGVKYTYKIETYKKEGTVTYKSVASADSSYYFVSRPSLSTPKNSSKGKMLVKWKKLKKVSGYEIQYSTSRKFKGAKKVTVKGASKSSKSISKLKKGKKYYVRVRAFKKSGSVKCYSAWSSAKSVKIRK